MGKKKNKKNNRLSNNSFLLDTSVQIESFKFPELNKYLNKKRVQGFGLVSSFFVLYEFKIGLIKSLIDFYTLLELTNDSATALAKWSDMRGRDPKYGLVLESMLHRNYDNIPTKDIKKYLMMIEAVIYNTVNNFDTFLDSLVGSFSNDEIVNFPIKTKDDFRAFVDKYNSRKVIPLEDFWKKNSTTLDTLVADTNFSQHKDLKKMYNNICSIHADIKKVNNFFINNGIGDAIIATDCPAKKTILSLDHSFECLAPALGKKFETLDKNVI